tara:strand:+ start:907 stop:1308 length:402 start_codon:yes stop_codon:yes gene_type:complete
MTTPIRTRDYKGVRISEVARLLPDEWQIERATHGDGRKALMRYANFFVGGRVIGSIMQQGGPFFIAQLKFWVPGIETINDGRKCGFFRSNIEARRWMRKRQEEIAEWLLKNQSQYDLRFNDKSITAAIARTHK